MQTIIQISKIIDQIIDFSTNSRVYTSECFNIAQIFEELKNRVMDFPTSNCDELNEILIELNKLLKVLGPLKEEDWLQSNLQVPIYQPITELKEKVSTIIELLQKIGIILDNKYDVSYDVLCDDLHSIYGMLLDSLRSSDQEYELKRNEIKEYLDTIEKPLIKLKMSPISSTDPLENTDFTNVQMYKLEKSSYTQNSSPVTFNNIYEIYEGQMNSTNEAVSIMEFQNYSEEKFKTLVNVLIAANHENLEKFIGAVNSPLSYVIVTSRRGKKLNEMIEQNCIPNGYKTKIAYQIAKGMAYLHTLKITHRDLCSFNVMVDDEFNARITNFANSRFIPEDLLIMSIQPVSLNTFTAPELSITDGYDESVDVFSFSAILYELLTGKPPFEGKSRGEIEELIQRRKRPDIKVNGASKDLIELISSCWSQEPKKRPSFTVILNKMLTKTITFPDEKENDLVLQFYESKKVESNNLQKCFELFEEIYEAISDSFSFHHEIYRIHTFIHSYHYALLESKYSKQTSFDEKIETIFYNLMISLQDLLKTIQQTEVERWYSIALSTEVLEIPNDLFNFMESIYISMECLGFDVHKYKLIKSDIVYDLRLCYKIFSKKEKEEAETRINEIKSVMIEYKLDLKPSQTELDDRFCNLFTHYKNFRVNRDDFVCSEKEKGDGMSCNVYKGKMKSTGQKVAIKAFKTDFLSDIKSERLLRREITFLSQLSNEYLVKFIGFNDDPGKPLWFITEFIKNPNLEEAIQNKDFLCPETKLKIAFEIAQGMEYLEHKRVIHRDLKPSNVLLDGEFSVGSKELTPKICDFGLARTDMAVEMTNKIGTIMYMAPEVINGGNYTFKVDVYSYGNLLYELYSSMKPFDWVSTKKEIYNSILTNKPLLYKEYIPKELKKLIEDTRSLNPDDRPSFTEIINRMIAENITFPGLSPKIAEKFYKKKIEERKKIEIY